MRLWSPFIFLAFLAVSTFGQQSDFCSSFSEGNHTTGTIRIKTLMTYSKVTRVDGGESFLYNAGCNNPDFFARTTFSRLKKPAKLDRFLDSLPDEKNYILELDASGRLVNSFIPVFGHLSWARSQFEIEEVHSIVDVSNRSGLIQPDYDAEAKLTNSGNSLRSINAEMMLLFLEPWRESQMEGLMSEKFIATDPAGRSYNRSNFKDLNRLRLFDTNGYRDYPASFVTEPDSVTKTADGYLVSGVMGIESPGGEKKKQVRYENTYRVTDDDFELLKSRFTRL